MYNRYNKVGRFPNTSETYQEILEQKKLNFINQYLTYDFKNLKFIESNNIEKTIHIVQPNDRLYNISQKYYGSPEFGWIICYTNKIPNELEIKIGDSLNIYFPIENILELL